MVSEPVLALSGFGCLGLPPVWVRDGELALVWSRGHQAQCQLGEDEITCDQTWVWGEGAGRGAGLGHGGAWTRL